MEKRNETKNGEREKNRELKIIRNDTDKTYLSNSKAATQIETYLIDENEIVNTKELLTVSIGTNTGSCTVNQTEM